MRHVILLVLIAILAAVYAVLSPRMRSVPSREPLVVIASGPASDTTDRDRGIAEIRRAQALAADGQVTEAIAAYDRAAALLPGITGWINLHAARAAAATGDTTTVSQRLAVAGSAIARDWGWDARVDVYEKAGAIDRAATLAEEAAAAFTGARRARAWTRAGELHAQRGQTDAARSAFRRALSASLTAYDAARQLTDLGGLTAADQLAIGRTYLRGGNMPRAARGIGAYLESGAGTATERRQLRLDLARGYFRAGEYDEAERGLLEVARNAPASIAAPAIYDAARAQYRSGNVTKARTTLRSIGERFPGSATAARAYYLLGDLDQDAERYADARANFRRAIETGADTDEVGRAHMRLAGMAFVAGDLAAARDAFQAYRTRYPSGRRIQQATYWAALSHLALGDSATARDLFRQTLRLDTMSYYGARAADRLGSTALFGTLADAPARTPLPAGAADALDRVDLLREIGWDEAASFEMSGARSSFGTDQAGLYSLAEALNERGNTSAGISLGRELHRRAGAWNERLLRIIYPFPYRDIIMTEARRHGIDPFVAAGLIRQESMFNPRAVSPAGAIGLMQVMPQTGAALAPRLQVTGFTPDMLLEPAVNVRLGMQFLADMIGRFDGRIDAVLAAYNAGPHRVERWQSFPEWRDVELFSERIPFEETRDYVKIVQQNARLYRALYGASAAGP